MTKRIYLALIHVFYSNVFFLFPQIFYKSSLSIKEKDLSFFTMISIFTFATGLVMSFITTKAALYTFLSILVSYYLFGYLVLSSPKIYLNFADFVSISQVLGMTFLMLSPWIIIAGVFQYITIKRVVRYFDLDSNTQR